MCSSLLSMSNFCCGSTIFANQFVRTRRRPSLEARRRAINAARWLAWWYHKAENLPQMKLPICICICIYDHLYTIALLLRLRYRNTFISFPLLNMPSQKPICTLPSSSYTHTRARWMAEEGFVHEGNICRTMRYIYDLRLELLNIAIEVFVSPYKMHWPAVQSASMSPPEKSDNSDICEPVYWAALDRVVSRLRTVQRSLRNTIERSESVRWKLCLPIAYSASMAPKGGKSNWMHYSLPSSHEAANIRDETSLK